MTRNYLLDGNPSHEAIWVTNGHSVKLNDSIAPAAILPDARRCHQTCGRAKGLIGTPISIARTQCPGATMGRGEEFIFSWRIHGTGIFT